MYTALQYRVDLKKARQLVCEAAATFGATLPKRGLSKQVWVCGIMSGSLILFAHVFVGLSIRRLISKFL